MRIALVLALVCFPATATFAATGSKAGRPATAVITPGWSFPGSTVRVHRGRATPTEAARGLRQASVHPKVVVVARRPRNVLNFPYPERDWTAERFGQSDWSGRSFGSSDFGRGPWGDYAP